MTDPDQPELDPIAIGPDEFLARRRRGGLSHHEQAFRYGVDGQRAADAIAEEVLDERLEAMVFMVLSMRRTVRPSAEALSWFPGPRVERILGQIELVSRTSLELAYHLCVYAPEALRHLPDDELHEWVLQPLEIYDHAGTQGCIRFMQQVAGYAQGLQTKRCGQPFNAVAALLNSFITGLSGRRLKLSAGEQTYTDTETLYVPKLPYRVSDIYRRITT